jgi:acyl carrier protein
MTRSNDQESSIATLPEVLSFLARVRQHDIAYTWLSETGDEVESLSYGALHERARAVGARLQSGAKPGDRALLLYPPGLDLIVGFFACLLAGVNAVPVMPPTTPALMRRLMGIAHDCHPTWILTSKKLSNNTSLIEKLNPKAAATIIGSPHKWLATDAISNVEANEFQPIIYEPTNAAFLQYTSGSTGDPKGVIVSHANLMHVEQVIQTAFETTADSRVVGWLPMEHDMGLIGNVLHPLSVGARCFLMSPATFLRRPLVWLNTISKYKGSVSGGPNFAYEYCCRHISVTEREQLDLSSWTLAFNGAEPIRNETLDLFATTFGSCGFRREALYPCYGLAEATLMVTGGDKAHIPAVKLRLPKHAGGKAGAAHQDDSAVLVSSGHCRHDDQIAIVEPTTARKCAPGEEGEIWISGSGVAIGYWGREQESEASFRATLDGDDRSYLRTGDLGFLEDNELFVTGRLRDLIVVRGQNHHPHDIEPTVAASHPALRPDRTVVTASDERQGGIFVIQEVIPEFATKVDFALVANSIEQAVKREHGLQVQSIAMVKKGSVLRTSSGKTQRRATLQAYYDGLLEVFHEWEAPRVEDSGSTLPSARRTDNSYRVQWCGSRSEIEAFIVESIARTLRISHTEIDRGTAFADLGLQSVAAVELVAKLEEAFGMDLPETLAWDFPTIELLVDHIINENRSLASS